MRPTRRLVLKRERLVELTGSELRDVVGGEASGATCPVKVCIDDPSDRLALCDSILRPCITWGTCTTL